MPLSFPEVSVLPIARYASLLTPPRMEEVTRIARQLAGGLAGRVVWNVSSTSVGGGVAEMVRSLLAYARGVGVDARWVVIEGSPAFFRVTKRLHNGLHGDVGDGSPLDDEARALYERISDANVAALSPMIRPRDVVIIHDPQPAGMIAALCARGAQVIWRCHVGSDLMNDEVRAAWRFLSGYVSPATAYVFSRAAFIPPALAGPRAHVIAPSLDPFSAKNQFLADDVVRAILVHTGIVTGRPDPASCRFFREDGTPGRVDRAADVVLHGAAPTWEDPLVVQLSRWDRLKDPVGVLKGFASMSVAARHGARLVLAGPDVHGVVDDPEGAEVFEEVLTAWRALPSATRATVMLVSLPTTDVEENAAMVNALQRHAAVVVQKSIKEGFGLTVTEAMWKGRPVVSCAVGGIRDQVSDGVTGILIEDARDVRAFAVALEKLLGDAALAAQVGAAGQARVFERYLGIDALLRYGHLIAGLDQLPVDEKATRALDPAPGSGRTP